MDDIYSGGISGCLEFLLFMCFFFFYYILYIHLELFKLIYTLYSYSFLHIKHLSSWEIKKEIVCDFQYGKQNYLSLCWGSRVKCWGIYFANDHYT